ncbi:MULTISPECIES: mechanosensitive ion channel family protein [unclassified Oceanobacter]|uniref:mechanosensitive ion channel family protein n=1 Tax=unclassified Oceanobacter TaxID=2620260 RepID=UPI0027376A32|nr:MULTISPECIES: mechanosensitive ion channel family protein [unclassified Oceanobacter]MDP2547132.1 mechanosensitive ion channel family protein [Oceanobacter sp. 4_MG-2023]MDP2609750.1 mechanosensitive ion channel family protein [Oceanobacter sp. 1_MG-2023]MDP2613081.1 mechanosensitive ion channel family protein [Oceanobacter sp. 2_MG-2023]
MSDFVFTLPDWWHDLVSQNYDWFWDVSIALTIMVVAAFVWRIVRKRLARLAAHSNNQWDDVLLNAIAVPVNWIIIAIGATWVADITTRNFQLDVMTSVPVVRQLSLIILVAWGIWRLINQVEQRQIVRGADPTTIQLVGKLAKVAVTILIMMPVFQSLGITISGLLAFGGVGGLVVGLAAKDLLANFFGSIVVYMDRPFKVGDWIRSPDRNIEGTVEHIGFRVTCIRTFDKRPLYVPNSVFTSIAVENPSRMLNRRIYETIGLRYQDSHLLDNVLHKIDTMLRAHPDIDTDQMIMVNFNSFGASSLDFFVYCFTKTTDWSTYHKVKQAVMLEMIRIIHAEGADCAFPTRTLHLESMPPAAAMANDGAASRV